MTVRNKYVLALGVLLVPAALLFGQAVSATLLGTVTDASGAVVPNAKVTITELNTGSQSLRSNQRERQLHVSGSSSGRYSVTVETGRVQEGDAQGYRVTVNTTTRIDVQVEPGNVTETVEVTGAPPLLQTDRADTGAADRNGADRQHCRWAPTATFRACLNLVPGTTRATFQHSQFFNASSSLQTEVNGQMRMGNSYQIEGIDNNERTGLLQILVPPIEAIQTVDVSTSNFEAELGRASGANTNVILKSGTNEFHGAAYEFLRNSDLNARNFFDASVGHLAYNYFGGNVGGPIKKNKIFFFGDILRVTDHEANTNLGTIPPGTWRTGDLSRRCRPSGLRPRHRQPGRHRTARRSPGNIIPTQPHQPDLGQDHGPGAGDRTSRPA